jgi:hypothetical protein
MILPSGSRLTWLWALVIGLSVSHSASPLWLAPGAPLHQTLCRLMQGLTTFGG